MQRKWITSVFIFIGAILLIVSSGIESSASEVYTVWFKIAGLIILMTGLYRAAKNKSNSKENIENDENRRMD